jgi:ribonuclease P protein component
MELKDHRLTKMREFQGVFAKGRGFREDGLFLKVKSELQGDSKFGVVVSKKVAKQAVVRNRIRRLVKEALRKEIVHIEKEVHAAVIVLPDFKDQGMTAVQKTVRSLFKKASLFQ